jgi:hypothetical protein
VKVKKEVTSPTPKKSQVRKRVVPLTKSKKRGRSRKKRDLHLTLQREVRSQAQQNQSND